MKRQSLRDQLIRHEGLRLKPYRDTVGKLTIGVGRNIEDVGITQQEAMMLLNNDIQRCIDELNRAFPWFEHLSSERQRALIDMCFNLGITRLLGFKRMLAALEAGDYQRAAREALDSRWANQVGRRADTIANMIRRG